MGFKLLIHDLLLFAARSMMLPSHIEVGDDVILWLCLVIPNKRLSTCARRGRMGPTSKDTDDVKE